MKSDLGKARCGITFYERWYAVSKSQLDFWKLTVMAFLKRSVLKKV